MVALTTPLPFPEVCAHELFEQQVVRRARSDRRRFPGRTRQLSRPQRAREPDRPLPPRFRGSAPTCWWACVWSGGPALVAAMLGV